MPDLQEQIIVDAKNRTGPGARGDKSGGEYAATMKSRTRRRGQPIESETRAALAQYAANAQKNIAGRFRRAEHALVQFMRTDKLKFKSLTGSLANDPLHRQTHKRRPKAPDGFFSGGDFNAGVAHAGAIAGQLGGRRRRVPAAAFFGAPRLHRGGVIGSAEVPAILRRGEGVFTPEQMRALGGTRNVEVIVNNHGAPKQATANITGGADGRSLVIGIMLDDLSRNGPISQGIGSRFAVPGRVT